MAKLKENSTILKSTGEELIATKNELPTAVGQLINDKNYVTQAELGNAGYGDMIKEVYDTNDDGIVDNAEKVNGFTVEANVPSDAKFTDTITSINGKTGAITKTDIVALGIPSQDTTYGVATTLTDGLMPNVDKIKLNGIENGANKYIHPTGDGNSHIPATGTTNINKVLKAGSVANSATWGSIDWSEVTNKPTNYTPATHTHDERYYTETEIDTKLSTKANIAYVDQNSGLIIP